MLKIARKLLLIGTFIIAALGGVGDGFAQSNSRERLFTVSGIEVDERAATAREARANAIAKAERIAFQRLLSRITQEKFTMPEGARASNFVLGIEIEEERNSRVRYIATLNITFDAAKIEALLGSQSIAYVGIAPKLTLVFPLLWQDGAWLLWQDSNAFRDVWTEEILQNRIMAYILPKGELSERTSITPDILMAGRQQERLKALLEAYDAEDILVVAARLERGAYGDTNKIIMDLIYPLIGLGDETIEAARVFPESDVELMMRATEEMIADQDIVWKANSLTQFGSLTELAISIPAEDSAGWAETLGRLKATPVVQTIEVRRLAMPISNVAITFIGTTEQLGLALAQKGLILLESAEGWVILREEAKDLVANGG